MPRRGRVLEGGFVYHLINRGNARSTLFREPGDYDLCERLLEEAVRRYRVRLLGYCLMPNHWHLVVWPEVGQGREVSRMMHWLTLTHSQRLHARRGTSGEGHVYQGRFKAFPVQTERYLAVVLRYVERNALRAGLVDRAEHWRWSSLWRRAFGSEEERAFLCDPPLAHGVDWIDWVNRPQTAAELEAVQTSIARGRPCGDAAWTAETARRLGLTSSLRSRGRPPTTRHEEQLMRLAS